MLPTPKLRHVADFEVELSPITEMGQGRGGRRRIIPIVGGRITGPCFTGEILNVGADWQTIFDMRGIDRNKGCVVIVRPDQYVAHILPLDAHAVLADFFSNILLPADPVGQTV